MFQRDMLGASSMGELPKLAAAHRRIATGTPHLGRLRVAASVERKDSTSLCAGGRIVNQIGCRSRVRRGAL